jgi:hypothetical protein
VVRKEEVRREEESKNSMVTKRVEEGSGIPRE